MCKKYISYVIILYRIRECGVHEDYVNGCNETSKLNLTD